MRRTFLAMATTAALLTACTDGGTAARPGTTNPGTPNPGTPNPGSVPADDDVFEWQGFGDGGRVQTGHLRVPIDYDDPSKGTIDLFVARHLADPAQRIGSLLVNPGGPGFGGKDFAIQAEAVYGDELLAKFDIIGWDPRGTGFSVPSIDCIDDYDYFYASSDITPDDTEERQHIVDVAEEFAASCVERNAEIIQYIGTNNTARDMNAIREALGEQEISYFGFSYGSELGATWATLFPDTVRAAVLDGASDPDAGFIEQGLQQAAGFESTLATFLAQCSADPSCAFHNGGDAEGAFDALMVAIDDDPLPSVDGRPEVNRQVAITATSEAMYSDTMWVQLADALADAQAGDGAGLLELYDLYYNRGADGSYENSLEAFQTIYCMDDAERLTVRDDDATVPQAQAVSPRLSPGTTGSYFCTFFPPSIDPRVEITGAGAGPILVMGTTGDAATPLASTRAMADKLEDGRLVIVTANQHTGYRANQCSQDVVDRYLVDPANNAPVDGTECS
ncbi:MAG: alpha/beta hydrolase [Actinomycetota bacterium]|nr:alpha/beta hydrolase [Actinomycetota bacterium]